MRGRSPGDSCLYVGGDGRHGMEPAGVDLGWRRRESSKVINPIYLYPRGDARLYEGVGIGGAPYFIFTRLPACLTLVFYFLFPFSLCRCLLGCW